jgi:CO/xanthine dehydrogenase Mo-binding subunit
VGVATGRETWVGRPLLRFEDEALLRGEGRFLDDLQPFPHACHAAIVRSQLAHARIGVDATAALAAPGVVGVLTGEAVRAGSRPFPAGIDTGVPQWALALDTARYAGEPVAVVVARDRYLAEDAAERVSVTYEPLPPVVGVEAARRADRAVHNDVADNVAAHQVVEVGDVETAMAAAPHRLTLDLDIERSASMPMEGGACTPAGTPPTGRCASTPRPRPRPASGPRSRPGSGCPRGRSSAWPRWSAAGSA